MRGIWVWAEYLGKKGLLDGKAAIQVSGQELHST